MNDSYAVFLCESCVHASNQTICAVMVGDDPACGMRRDGDDMYGDRVRYMVCG